MKKAIAYARVSTDQQDISLDAQRDRMVEWAKKEGIEIVGFFQEQISGGTALDEREGLLAAIQALKENKAELLLVTKRDRLARESMYAAMIDRMVSQAKAKVFAVDNQVGNGDSPEDVLMRTLVDAFAQYERAQIKMRTKMALLHKKKSGEVYSPVPFGFRAVEGRLEQVEAEAELVAEILAMRGQGKTLRAIADSLNDRGIQGKRGG